MHSFPGFSRLRMHTKGGSPVAFVEYQDVRYAAQAMATLQGSFLLSSDRGAIRIEYAKSKMAEVGFTNLWIEVGFILCYASRYRHPVYIPTKTQRPCATHPLRYLDFCRDISPISTPYLVDQRHPCDHRGYSLAFSLSRSYPAIFLFVLTISDRGLGIRNFFMGHRCPFGRSSSVTRYRFVLLAPSQHHFSFLRSRFTIRSINEEPSKIPMKLHEAQICVFVAGHRSITVGSWTKCL